MLYGWQAIIGMACVFTSIPLAALLLLLYKPKKTYCVVWSYDSQKDCSYTEWVKARDIVEAWNKVRKKHCMEINCRKIVVFKE